MRAPFLPSQIDHSTRRLAPWLIAVGFVGMLAGVCSQAASVATAMALIAMGATMETTHRVCTPSKLCLLIAIHLIVYLNLYFLFVGAVCHGAIQLPRHGIAPLQGLDLAVSVVPMAWTIRRSLAVITGAGIASSR